MAKQVINVGTDPGGQNDGDTLRDAFIKTQANFDELYTSYFVTDTTLDHDDPGVEGTIANALALCAASGGGTVHVGAGEFNLASQTLVLGEFCNIIGSGNEATTLVVQHGNDAIRVDSGTFGRPCHWSVKDLSIELPVGASGDGIVARPARSTVGRIEFVTFSGGAVDSWAVTLDACNQIEIRGVTYNGQGNGIRWINTTSLPANYGDGLIEHCSIFLVNENTTGIEFLGPPLQATNRINNILVSQVSISIPQPNVLAGTTGIRLQNAGRIMLSNIDLERMDIGILQESGVNGGTQAQYNGFFQVYALGCVTDYSEVGTTPVNQTILGGQGIFATDALFPTPNLRAEHPVLGRHRVLTAIRPIEANTSGATRTLVPADAGKVFTNGGAGGTVTFALPPANASASMEYEFHVATGGQKIRVTTDAGDFIRSAIGPVTITTYESDASLGTNLKVRNINGASWSVLAENGTWTSI